VINNTDEITKKIKDNIAILIEKGNLDNANKLIKEYEEVVSSDLEIYSMKAVMSMMIGDKDRAEDLLLEGLLIDGKSFDLLYNLAYLYQSKGQNELAIEYYKKSLQNAADETDADRIYEILKELGAKENKAELISANRRNRHTTNEEALKGRKIKEEAKVLDEFVGYKEQFKNNVRSLMKQGLLEQAKVMLSEYEEIVNDDIDTISIKGVIALNEADINQAEKIFKEGLDIQPYNCDLLYNLAFLYEKQDKYITAYRYYSKIIKLADKEMIKEINKKLEELENISEVYEYKNRRKVLVIAYAFPPIGGSGIQRTLKFVSYLREFGWEPIVLTVGETAWTMKDISLMEEVPKEIEVVRIDDVKPEEIDITFIKKLVTFYSDFVRNQSLYKEYLEKLRENPKDMTKYLLIPEYQSAWAMKVCEDIDKYIDVDKINMVYTSADPYSDTFIGHFLKKKYNKLWVADFRDEWTNHHYKEYDKNSIRYKIEFAMEKTVVQTADKVITTTSLSSSNYRSIFNLPKNKVETITNGYDEKDFQGIKLLKKRSTVFTIMHNGIFHDGKNPLTFLYALSNLINKKLINKSKIKVYFTREDSYMNLVKKLNLHNIVEHLGYIEHKKSLEIASNCDALLLVVGHGERLKQVHAAKLFEYIRLGKPILSLAPQKGVIDSLINEMKRGYNVDYNDIEDIEKYLLKLYKEWDENKLETFTVTEDVQQFERKVLTGKLSDIFEDLLQKEKCKEDIKEFIKNGKLNEAKKILNEYRKIAEGDIEIYSIMGIIAMMESKADEAEKNFLIGIEKDNANFDLLYNLAYLYESLKSYDKAMNFYKKAEINCVEPVWFPIFDPTSIKTLFLPILFFISSNILTS